MKISNPTTFPHLGWTAKSFGESNEPTTSFLPGFRNAVVVHRLMTASHPSPRRLLSCSSVNPTTHDRPTVTSALNVLYASQSCDTPWGPTVGHRPPAKVSFRLCAPAVAWSADCSILTGGSL